MNSARKSSDSSQAVKYPSAAETAWAIHFPEDSARAGGKPWLARDLLAVLQWWDSPAPLPHHPSGAPHGAEVSRGVTAIVNRLHPGDLHWG